MRKRNSAYFKLGIRENAPEAKETKQTIPARPIELLATEVLTITIKPITAPRTVVAIRIKPFWKVVSTCNMP